MKTKRNDKLNGWHTYNGTRVHYLDGMVHNEPGLPAIFHADGRLEYREMGKLIRIEDPKKAVTA